MDLSSLFSIIRDGAFFLVVLSFVVFLHELGHYLAARWVGAKVEEFAIGFGPAIWQKKYGETNYRINCLPLGGYCQIQGEIDDNSDPRSLSSKKWYQKILVLVAGVTMNVILAVIVCFIYLSSTGFVYYQPKIKNFDASIIGGNVQEFSGAFAGDVSVGGPLSDAGVNEPVLIYTIDGISVKNRDELANAIKDKFEQNVKVSAFSVKQAKQIDYNVYLDTKNDKGDVILGVSINPLVEGLYIVDYNSNKLFSGFAQSINYFSSQIASFKFLYNSTVETGSIDTVRNNVSGIIGLAQMIHRLVENNLGWQILNLIALFNIGLAFMNLLPIPGLDGGHVLFVLIETITGRKINEKLKGYLIIAGMGLILILFVLITFNDLTKVVFIQKFFEWIGLGSK